MPRVPVTIWWSPIRWDNLAAQLGEIMHFHAFRKCVMLTFFFIAGKRSHFSCRLKVRSDLTPVRNSSFSYSFTIHKSSHGCGSTVAHRGVNIQTGFVIPDHSRALPGPVPRDVDFNGKLLAFSISSVRICFSDISEEQNLIAFPA